MHQMQGFPSLTLSLPLSSAIVARDRFAVLSLSLPLILSLTRHSPAALSLSRPLLPLTLRSFFSLFPPPDLTLLATVHARPPVSFFFSLSALALACARSLSPLVERTTRAIKREKEKEKEKAHACVMHVWTVADAATACDDDGRRVRVAVRVCV